MIVEGKLMVVCVCVRGIEPIHRARQKSLLRPSGVEVGLCLNFHADSMATEVRRFSNPTKK
jgi:hypothetical protein